MACLENQSNDVRDAASGSHMMTQNLTNSKPTPSVISMKYAGLDPVNRTFLKLFIRDVISLEQCAFQEVDSIGFCFHGHVVERVEIMGIIVRVDLKDIKHSYVIDDATGVILCNLWKNKKQACPGKINDLPKSLQEKNSEIRATYTFQNEGFHHGDLVRIRGRVVMYGGRKEIDILDISKFNNPNCELERVLELPDLYAKCYCKPFSLPDFVSKESSDSEFVLNVDTLKCLISKHVEHNRSTLDTFSVQEVLTWPSLKSFNYSNSNNTCEQLSNLIESALKAVSESQGLIFKRFDMKGEYEVIKEGCAFCKEVLKIFHMLHQETRTDSTGYHTNQIHSLLNRSSRYAGASPMVLKKTVQCLENASDIISVDSNRYVPLS